MSSTFLLTKHALRYPLPTERNCPPPLPPSLPPLPTMKLLSHNFLRNNTQAAGFSGGYPLAITASEITVTENEYNEAFVKHIIPSLDWPVLCLAATQLGLTTLPSSLTPEILADDSFLAALHHVLVNVHVVAGVLTCPTTGKEFPIRDGIADFTLEEDECVNVKI